MGADLYIENLPYGVKRYYDISEKAVESGYFRDWYGSFGLFAVMTSTLNEQFSWWKISDKREWFNDENDREENGTRMTPEGCKLFLEWIKPKLEQFINTKRLTRKVYLKRWEDGPTTIKITKEDDINNVKNHAKLFLKFCQYACEANSYVLWSV